MQPKPTALHGSFIYVHPVSAGRMEGGKGRGETGISWGNGKRARGGSRQLAWGGRKCRGVLHDVRVIGGGHGMGFGEGGTLPQVMGSGAKPRKLSGFRVFEGRKYIKFKYRDTTIN